LNTAANQTVVSARRPLAVLFATFAVSLIYFVAARLSLLLLEPVDGVAVFWPAAGVASGILIAFGTAARWPVLIGVAVATIAANLLGDRNIGSSVFFAVANAGEALIVAGLIQRFYGSPFELNELRKVLALFAAAIAGTSLSGIAGTIGFVVFHGSSASASVVWLHWFLSDGLGTVAVAPLAIGLAALRRDFPPQREIAEGGLALAVISIVCALLILLPNQPWTVVLAVGALCPLLLWTASRLRPAFTALATFICAITIVWATIFAIGIFGDLRLSIEQRVLAAQATILAISLGALVLAALFSERRLHESALLEREARLQEALRAGQAAWKSAELADRAKSSFLAAASHDLRQPLQTLRLLHAALEPHHPDGDARNVVAGIGRSLNTMSSILSSLLDVNRLESGNLRPSPREFSLRDVFESLAADFAAALQEKSVRLRLIRCNLVVRSDRRMLEEMIRNLLSNSVRYTDRGRILLGCRRAGDNVRIEVWDTGVGITEDQLQHVFDEYYQGTAGAERGGFGLGLAIVRRLGEVLEHPVDVRSIPGRGTRFSIEVPLGRSATGVDHANAPVHLRNEAFPFSVLAIEDETTVRTALRRFFREKGIKAAIVATAADALTLIREQGLSPDLLLCDYNLRGSPDGVTTIDLLRAALGRKVPAVVMTGDIRSQTISSIASQGVAVLIKPFVAEELLQALQSHAPPFSPSLRS
jgi:signal transduction histidine kinase/ActR/RegA family two-component response regulator